MTEDRVDPTAELNALKQVADALSELDDEARARVLRWAADRFNVTGAVGRRGLAEVHEGGGETEASAPPTIYEDVASLFSAAGPSTEADKALVVGYWVQYQEGASEFEAFTLNKHLKQLGHGVGNITNALDKLKARKPQLVMQTKKSGTSRQARKKYKLTSAGKQAVEAMLNGE